MRIRRNDMLEYMLKYILEMLVFFASMCRPALHAVLTQCFNLGLKQFVWAKIGNFWRNDGLLKRDFKKKPQFKEIAYQRHKFLLCVSSRSLLNRFL